MCARTCPRPPSNPHSLAAPDVRADAVQHVGRAISILQLEVADGNLPLGGPVRRGHDRVLGYLALDGELGVLLHALYADGLHLAIGDHARQPVQRLGHGEGRGDGQPCEDEESRG